MKVRPSPEETDQVAGYGAGNAPLRRGERKELLKRYRTAIAASKKWRKAEGYDDTWERLRDIYRLKMFEAFEEGDRIAVAIAFATINVIAPSVAVNHPKVTVWPAQEGSEAADKATITEAVVNYWWRRYKIKPQFRAAVKDSLVYGHGWLKVGYRYEEGARVLNEDELAEDLEARVAEADQFALEAPELADQLPSDDEIAAAHDGYTTEVVTDAPFAERVSPFDILVDPESINEHDMGWIAQRCVYAIDDVKDDERYDAKARRALEPDGTVKWHLDDDKEAIAGAQRVTVWEFYDLHEGTFSCFTEQGDRFLREPEAMPYVYGQPFVMLRNYDVPDQFYPIGEIEAIEPLQNELNDTRTGMVRARRLDSRKLLYRKDSIGSKGMDALTSDVDNALVEVTDDRPFTDVIAPVPRNDANAELYRQHSEVIESDIDRVTGVNEYMRGALPEVRRTATEASIIQDAANARAADKLDTIEGFIGEIAQRLVMLGQQYLSTEQVARVVGPNGKAILFKFDRTDIEGQFDFEVEAGSTQPQNETFRRQQAMQLLQVLQPMFPMGVINVPSLLTHVLREGFGIKNPEQFVMEPQPIVDPATGMTIDPVTGQPMDPMAAAGGAAPPASEEAPPENALGGTDAVPAAQIAQLMGQTGFNPQTLVGAA